MKKIYLILVVVLVLILVVILTLRPKNEKLTDDENSVLPEKKFFSNPLPTSKPTITSLDPDVIFPTLPPKVQVEVDGIRNLRNKTPIANSGFKVDYDYKINKFVVTFEGGKNSKKIADFKKWLSSNGYGGISQDYFEYN